MKTLYLSVFLFFFSCISAEATSYSWDNAGNGDWSVAANWMPNGVPGAGDDVSIANGGTVTLDVVDAMIASMTMSSGTLTGSNNISLSGTLTWSGGTIGGTGTMTVAGATTITNSPALTARTLTLNGGGTWSPPVSSAAFFTNDNASIIVPAGQTLTFTTTGNSSFSSTSGAGVFTLHGILEKKRNRLAEFP